MHLSRGGSFSSDDGQNPLDQPSKSPAVSKRERLKKMRQFHSLPSTPGHEKCTAGESLAELLGEMRRQRSASARTDSSLSDGGGGGGERKSTGEINDLSTFLDSRCELSDEEADRSCEGSMEVGRPASSTSDHGGGGGGSSGGEHGTRSRMTTLRSVFCSLL